MTKIKECKNCGSSSLSWFSSVRVTSGVVEGRLRSNEVEPIFVLGCDECSETLAVVSGGKVAEFLNQQLP